MSDRLELALKNAQNAIEIWDHAETRHIFAAFKKGGETVQFTVDDLKEIIKAAEIHSFRGGANERAL